MNCCPCVNTKKSVCKIKLQKRKKKKLKKIVIPACVTTIEKRAFYQCEKLKEVVFAKDSQLQTIADSAFYHCRSLKQITIPACVTAIGDDAFARCYKMQSITFGQGSRLQRIGCRAFAACKETERITLPACVHTISPMAFSFAKALEILTFSQKLADPDVPGANPRFFQDLFLGCRRLHEINLPARLRVAMEMPTRYRPSEKKGLEREIIVRDDL